MLNGPMKSGHHPLPSFGVPAAVQVAAATDQVEATLGCRCRSCWSNWRLVALLVLVRRHVTRQVMSLAEALVANRTLQLLLALPTVGVAAGELALMMGPHVINQIAGHAEADVALGANILSGQCERGGDRGRDQ